MKQGTVKWFEGSYGFITPGGVSNSTHGGGNVAAPADVFVHQRAIVAGEGEFRTLSKGEVVHYEDEPGPKGRRATKVIRAGAGGAGNGNVSLTPAASGFTADQRRG